MACMHHFTPFQCCLWRTESNGGEECCTRLARYLCRENTLTFTPPPPDLAAKESKLIGHNSCGDSPPSHKHCTIRRATSSAILLLVHDVQRAGS